MTCTFGDRYRGRRVLVTGHTGFKGSWLCEWLLRLGADVHGYGLAPKPHETLFGLLGLQERISSHNIADVRSTSQLTQRIRETQPDIIFHLAAQALVRASFQDPRETFTTNVVGTVNVLEAVRQLSLPCAVVVVTTDKCYENREWVHAYREDDPLGGYDPYSASKGCAELVTSAYRRSFFSDKNGTQVGSARAGNVIGGGDWAADRIMPDIFRAIFSAQAIRIRNGKSTRPWQHVLEPLSGYLWLGALLDPAVELRQSHDVATSFNFGPGLMANRTVLELVEEVLKHVGGEFEDATDPDSVHEASKLNLATDKAYHLLQWCPTWDFETAVRETVEWYVGVKDGRDARDLCGSQIDNFCEQALTKNIAWRRCEDK